MMTRNSEETGLFTTWQLSYLSFAYTDIVCYESFSLDTFNGELSSRVRLYTNTLNMTVSNYIYFYSILRACM